MGTAIKVWGEGRSGLWSVGGLVDIPDEFVEIPTGDAFITRKVKELAETAYVRMKKYKRGGFSRAVGVLIPKPVLEAAKRLAGQTEESRLKHRKAATGFRQRKEARFREEVTARMLVLFPKMPPDEARLVAEHAFEVGSGRVGRTTSVDLDVKIKLAVKARIRHQHTDYDELLALGHDREWIRQQVLAEVEAVYREWEAGQVALPE